MKLVGGGIWLATVLCLLFTPDGFAYDVVYHQDEGALVIDQKCALLPAFERKVLLRIASAIGKLAIPKNSVLIVTLNQNGKVISVRRQGPHRSIDAAISKAVHQLSFDAIPFGVGSRTLALAFTMEELRKTLNRRNVSITAG